MMTKRNFLKKINSLTKLHYKNSKDYEKIINNIYFKKTEVSEIEKVPFLPSRIFKDISLKSIPDEKVFKVLNSSGTSSSGLSKIYLDKINAAAQTNVLNKIVSKILGTKRLPMIILDEKKNINDPKRFNAKTAAYLGFSLFGRNNFYMIKDGKIDYKNLNIFLENFSNEKFLIFGFTSNVYDILVQNLNLKKLKYKSFKKAVLIHGGGWKKMENKKISNLKFKELLLRKLKLNQIYNYYGLIEQTGSIFFESEKCGFFTTNEFSEILIRDKNFKIAPNGSKGFVQLLSLLPTSYPGHSILTEDIGQIFNIKNCKCGNDAKHFLIHGRLRESELRGCSDV